MKRSEIDRVRRVIVRKVTGVREIVRTFRWTCRELAQTKKRLAIEGVEARAERPVDLSTRGYRGLNYAMRLVRPSCLERALVIQAWDTIDGRVPDVVVGVRMYQGRIEAHAWVDDADDPLFDDSYEEITRLTV